MTQAKDGVLRTCTGLAGMLLVLAQVQLEAKMPFHPEFDVALVYVGWRESLFWLSSWLLLLPAMLLLAWSVAPALEAALARLSRALARPAWLGWGGWLLVVGWTLAARLGRRILLLDLPLTGDEWGVQFGARIWASGQWTIADFAPAWGFSPTFAHVVDGRLTSMDFPGAIAFQTVALVTHAGPWLYAAFSALAGLALARACGRLEGPRGFWLAAALWTCSPMIWSLSLTEHAHLVSRSLVAFAYAAYVRWYAGWRAGRPSTLRDGALLGLCAAAAGLVRPAEAACLLLPLGLHRCWLARQEGRWQAVGAAAALAALGPALLWSYNAMLAGEGSAMVRRSFFDPSLSMLGTNFGFNVAMLSVFFAGPLLWLALPASLADGQAPARVCLAAVALHLCLAMAHHDTGIHLVGPIHYSETAVPLLILAVVGLLRCVELAARLEVPPARLAVFGVFAALWLVLFTSGHGRFLVAQAAINQAPLEATSELPPSIVIADYYETLWRMRPDFAAGSFVRKFPPVDPLLRDRVLFAYAALADVEALRREFPDRRLYRMTYNAQGPPFRLTPLGP
jgi:hypothetical protein